jgi:photosystem II PsbU protein
MTRLIRRLASLLLSCLLLVGVWLSQPLMAQAEELRNLADDKIAQAQGKVDLNNASVRRFQQYPGMYPTLAGKIVVGGPYSSVDDVLKLDLTERQQELFQKYRDNFTVTQPEIALNEGFDRINDGQYR